MSGMEYKQMQSGGESPVICPSCFFVFCKYGVIEDKCPKCNSPFTSADVVGWIDDKGAWEVARALAKIRKDAKEMGGIKR